MRKTHTRDLDASLFNTLATGTRSFDIVLKEENYEAGDYVLYRQIDETLAEQGGDITLLTKITSVNKLAGLQDEYVIIALTKID